jgi:hypothetical protein
MVAAGAITFGVGAVLVAQFGASSARSREAEVGPLQRSQTADPRLFLGQASTVAGSRVMRAELLLHEYGGGFSSGGYSETRNILFIDPVADAPRWLLPDDDHVITEHSDVMAPEHDDTAKRLVCTVALVKAREGDRQVSTGRLLLFGPAGMPLVEVAVGVRALHLASLSGEQVTVLYERDRQLFVATFDTALVKQNEQMMTVPPLG